MSTEVLLLADVEKLGKAGDLVHVADGYARNFLFPQDLAAITSPAALRKLEKLRKEREEVARIQKAEAAAKAAKLEGASVTIRAKTTDGTKLYGSVTAADICAAIEEATKVAIEKTQLDLADPIKEVGTFDITVTLCAGVVVPVKVWVVEE